MDVAGHTQSVLEWTEKHAGLGGWVGAFGAVIAIFVTWGLARAEYLRSKRQRMARVKEEIFLISSIVYEFDAMVHGYERAALGHDSTATVFFVCHMTDPKFLAANDLASLPVTQWPSFSAYSAFKRYWYFAQKVLETSNSQPINLDSVKDFSRNRREALDGLNTVLSLDERRLSSTVG
jgi:hypothetical protein